MHRISRLKLISISFIALLIGGVIAFKFRYLFRPLLLKFKGKKTVEEVVSKLKSRILKKLEVDLLNIGVEGFPANVSFVAIKSSRTLEAWTELNGKNYLIKTYPFTAFSGKLGPKLKDGDRQIPEGIYGIEYLNPNSMFHLSLKISYPNEFDLSRAKEDGRKALGGDIMIHGNSVTIGCIPVGDPAIEEIFCLAAHAGLKKCKVIISPVDFRKNEAPPSIKEIKWLDKLYEDIKKEIIAFQDV